MMLACQSEVTLHLLSGVSSGWPDAGPEVPPGVCQPLGLELCNGGDDDCNGVVDEGCANTVLWSDETQSAILGHATGGVDFQAPCPRGSVLAGLRVGMGTWLNMVGAMCLPISLEVDTHGTPVLGSFGTLFLTSYAPAGSTDMKNQLQTSMCPQGLLLSGIDGTTANVEAKYIYGLQVRCAPPIVMTAGGAAVVTLDLTRQQTLAPVVCATCSATQPFDYSATVPAGQIGTGIFGGDGLWDDRVGLDSSRATIGPR
jgi:hypothetical protein